MATVAARIKGGDMLLAGNYDERKPLVESGLHFFSPFDGTTRMELWGGIDKLMVANGAIQDVTLCTVNLGGQVTVYFSGEWKKSADFNGTSSRYLFYLKENGVSKYHSFIVDSYLVADEWVHIEGSITINYTGVITEPRLGVGIRNTATTGQLECRNCHCWIEPSTADNVVVNTYGLSADKGTVNIAASVTSSPSYVTVAVDDGWYKAQQIQGGYAFRTYVDLADLTNGETYSGSVDVYNPNPFPISIRLDWCDQGSKAETIAPYQIRRIGVAALRATYDATFRFLDFYCEGLYHYWVRNVQVEYKKHYTQFTDGTRVDPVLEYPITTGADITFHLRRVDALDGSSTDKTIMGMGKADDSQYINVFHGWGNDFYVGDNTVRTNHRITDFAFDEGQLIDYFIIKSGTNVRVVAFKDGGAKYYDDNITDANYTFAIEKFRIGRGLGNQNGSSRMLTDRFIVYDRVLTDDEMNKIVNSSYKITQDGDLKNVELVENYEWIKVYEGLCTNLSKGQTFTDDLTTDLYGDAYEFDEMKVVAPFWGHETIAYTTERAKLKYGIKWYMEWLFNQPDVDSPQMKFHGLDDVQDVGFTTANLMMWGYGNTWRRITAPFFVISTAYCMYLGGVPSEVHKTDWFTYFSDDDYFYFPHHHYDACRESGVHSLTPREFQTICIYIRKTPSKDVPVRATRDGKFNLQGDLQDGQTLT